MTPNRTNPTPQLGRETFTTSRLLEYFIAWLEGKLKKHHVEKSIPNDSQLKIAFSRANLAHRLNQQIDEIFDELRDEADATSVPGNLRKQVRNYLSKNPGDSWDEGIAHITQPKIS